MKSSTLGKAGLALGAGTVLALATALPASAHVSLSASSTAAGSSSLLSFSVPHGCEGSPTISIAISLPEQILGATPTIVPGWEVEKVTEELAASSTDAHGAETTERVARVVYTAVEGGLADGYRQQFDVQVTLPDLAAGTELGFPVVQGCELGEAVWDGDTLPTVTLTAASGGAHGPAGSGRHDDPSTAHDTAPDSAPVDALARVLGIGGLAVGTAALLVTIAGRRTPPAGS